MGSSEKTLVILGADGAGKATITGCMLFKYGGIEMPVMQMLERSGVRDTNRRYGEAVDNLKSLSLAMKFYTPKRHVVTIIDASAQADCAVLVVPADSGAGQEFSRDYFSNAAKQLIVVINKMDVIDWSEEHFQKIVEDLGFDTDNIPIIPISARDGDNVVEQSTNSPWYKGWKKANQSGMTLLEAFDVSLQA